MQQQVAVLIFTDAREDYEAQLHVMVTLLTLRVLHHNRAEGDKYLIKMISEMKKKKLKLKLKELHVMVTLLTLGVLHHNRTEECYKGGKIKKNGIYIYMDKIKMISEMMLLDKNDIRNENKE